MTGTQHRPAELEQAITEAVAAFHAGKLNQAESLCQQMIRRFSAYPDAFTTYGHLLMSARRNADSIAMFRRALEKDRSRIDLHVQLGNACTKAGQFKLAAQVLEDAEKEFPDNAEILNCQGNALTMQRKYAEAAKVFSKAIKILPDWPTPRENLCSMLYELRKYDEAVKEAQTLLSINPDNAVANNTLGVVMLEKEKTTEAIELLEKAMHSRPRDVAIVHNVGLAYSNAGNIEKAREMYRTALEIQPTRVEVLQQLLHITKMTDDAPEWKALDNIQKYYEVLPDKAKYQFHFSLGKAHADIGKYDKAFENYRRANEIKHDLINSDLSEAEERFECIKEIVTPAFLAKISAVASNSEKPVFIVGMPRSGSTLIEQIISSHPAANGGGEMTVFPELIGATETESGKALAEHLRSISSNDFKEIIAGCLAAFQEVDATAERVCDKQLANFLLLPLLVTMFPKATIVHCLRNPLDTCLSCYFNDFARSHFYTTKLEELGRFYRMYRDLMDTWQEQFDFRIHTVQYESLVENPEAESKKLIQAIGLTWDKACLAPHESQKGVRTASVAQVRQPIYKSSVNRWRAYADHLQPLVQALGPYGKTGNESN